MKNMAITVPVAIVDCSMVQRYRQCNIFHIPHSLPVQYTYCRGKRHIFHWKLDRLELAMLSRAL